jgi:hypothetical protein
MRTHNIFLTIGLILVLCWTFSLPAEAQEFKGSLKLGYRFLNTDGSDFKYKEDINLVEGGYLPEFTLHFTPSKALQNLFDRLDLSIRNLGNEPFQTFDISLKKFGAYDFKWARRKSTYFYSDETESSPGHLYDFHSFDFDRVSDSGSLKVWLSPNVQLFADYDAYTKQGASITTLDINRIEFEFDKPVSESNREIAVGITANWQGYSFLFEERIQDYENDFGFFLPGYADGGAGARYPSDLLYFTQNQPYDFKTYNHTFRLNARPFSALIIKGSARLSDMDMNLSYDEAASGTNYLNRPFSYSLGGSGEFERQIKLLDLDLTFMLSNRLALVSAVRHNDFEQNGSLNIAGESMAQDFAYDTLGVDAGLQFQASQAFTLTGGYRFEERSLENLETFLYEDKTTRHGFFGNVSLVPSRNFRANLDYQYGDYDNPYTMIAPTKFNRFRATARLSVQELYFSGLLQVSKKENDALAGQPWESSRTHFNLRAGYHGEKVKLFAGYGLINIEHEADRTVSYPPGWAGAPDSFSWTIDYEGKSSIFDASVMAEASELARVGAYVNFYQNSGFWEIDRTMLKAYLQYDLPIGIFTELALRYIDFEEELSGLNDYSATIFELNFGYRWQ